MSTATVSTAGFLPVGLRDVRPAEKAREIFDTFIERLACDKAEDFQWLQAMANRCGVSLDDARKGISDLQRRESLKPAMAKAAKTQLAEAQETYRQLCAEREAWLRQIAPRLAAAKDAMDDARKRLDDLERLQSMDVSPNKIAQLVYQYQKSRR